MDEELGDETEMRDAESPADAAVASGVYMVHTDEVIEYINTVLPQSEGINVYEGAIFEKMRYYLGFTSAAGILSALPKVEPGIFVFHGFACDVFGGDFGRLRQTQAQEGL